VVDERPQAAVLAAAMPTLDAAGGTLHYEDDGAGAPVVCVHGWSLSSRVWEGALGAAAAGRRILAPDLRGHGRTRAPGPFTLEHLAGDLALLVEALGLERAVLVGWSLGAQVALAALPRMGRRIAGLVLVAATPRFTAGGAWPHGVAPRTVAALARQVERDPARTAARFFEGMFADGELDAAARERVLALRGDVPVPEATALRAGLDVLASADLVAALPGCRVPALVIHGERDPVCPPAAGRALAQALPDARLALVATAGHAPFLSRPAEFAALAGGFLGAVA
jgi:pimeloyl-ACP methyl ester esterase